MNSMLNGYKSAVIIVLFCGILFAGCRREEMETVSTLQDSTAENSREAVDASPMNPPLEASKESTPEQSPTPTPTPTPEPTPEPDTEAPVILGVSDITVYLGDSISYRKNISVTDNSGETISLEIDNSAVVLNQLGSYPVIYTARDSAGNVATLEATVNVVERPAVSEESVSALADELIAELTTPEMSNWDKAYVLWNWCRTEINYSYTSGDRSSIWAGAYEGLHNRRGDCYAYYATYSVLLTRLGIENICVSRVGEGSNHWWNLVNLGDGWYHCDPSPRKKEHMYKCFMQTDAQIQAYADFYVEHPDYYTFDTALYPERATEVVFESQPDAVR